MKTVTAILLIFVCISAGAQKSGTKTKRELKAEKLALQKAETKMLVENKTFVFDVQTVNPMRGRTVHVTSDYDVRIQNDSIYSYLPFYGRAYSINYGGTQSPLIFEQAIEGFVSTKTKNGYSIDVHARNQNDMLDFSFHVTESGSTTLTVNSVNRQSISYFGQLEKVSDKKEKQ